MLIYPKLCCRLFPRAAAGRPQPYAPDLANSSSPFWTDWRSASNSVQVASVQDTARKMFPSTRLLSFWYHTHADMGYLDGLGFEDYQSGQSALREAPGSQSLHLLHLGNGSHMGMAASLSTFGKLLRDNAAAAGVCHFVTVPYDGQEDIDFVVATVQQSRLVIHQTWFTAPVTYTASDSDDSDSASLHPYVLFVVSAEQKRPRESNTSTEQDSAKKGRTTYSGLTPQGSRSSIGAVSPIPSFSSPSGPSPSSGCPLPRLISEQAEVGFKPIGYPH